ncbi:MAG: hypothetical protein Q7V20_16350 [Aquabacterium sp.]|uniref:hypothetical protein n=1 Tax=Aquabacterium sp. TaxID=1872578 RepID=UPI00271B10B9|nr:hypothetical protein [Aquabacterium sp.]MDO9005016.1 hypothetical protein [Aquabacterium sp.]
MSYRDELLKAYNEGNFLNAVYDCLSADHEARQEVVFELASLHNEKLVDVVEAFSALSNGSANGPDFFLTRDVFQQALPHIDAAVLPVMRCVLNLYRSAGQDFAAGTIVGQFVEYCARQLPRSRDALTEIEANPNDFSDLLAATLSAGFRSDCQTFLLHAVRLSKDANIDLRRGAVISIANFDSQGNAAFLEEAVAGIESCVDREIEDSVLAASLRTIYALLRQDGNQEERFTELIAKVLSKGNEFTIHAASEVLFLHTAALPEPLVGMLLSNLTRVKPTHKGTLDNIDYGISHLIKGGSPESAIRWLEGMLLTHPKELSIGMFDSVVGVILGDNVLLSKILTRWLVLGERALCSAVHDIVAGAYHREERLLEIDISELQSTDAVHMFFLARKIIGYLFMQPISAASLMVSLMRQTEDVEVLAELGALLFDPLLLNYTGKVREYAVQQVNVENGKVKEALEEAIKAVDEYLEGLRSVGVLPALYPSTAQREAYRRQFSRQMTKSMEEVEEKSVFSKLFTKSVLLYGGKSINYVHGVNGQMHRMETPLHSHGVEIEFPRMQNLDPFGLDYMLRVFRNERFQA